MTEKEQQRLSRVVWFEIPAVDLARATAFYEDILQLKMRPYQGVGVKMNIFPYTEPAISGAVIEGGAIQPGQGSVVYLNADPSLDDVLNRVESAGGSILLGRTELPPGMGVFAQFRDTEGNAVGLHAVS
jgi:predicted enzyme related to lactoylglutathione lyase